MNPPICRWLPTECADGATNMARDEALLLSAEKGVASFRLYTWSEATLSLGYFQPEALRQSDPLLASIPFVRRSSGGGAIVHHREVTYSLALPNGPVWQTKESWLCRMHHLLVEVLRSFGVESRTVVCGEEKKLGEVLCFQHQTPGDLLIGTEKIVGSAQRRHRGALMQHGSILLEQSPYALALPGMMELTGKSIPLAAFEQVLVDHLQKNIGWQLVPSNWTEEENRSIEEIKSGKYANDEWNRKR